MKFCVFILFVLLKTISSQQTTSVRICSDDYRYTSYPLKCAKGLLINIINVYEVFIKQNTFPDCNDNGFNFNYSKPFVDFCNARDSCEINAKFLEEQKLFSAETYPLADTSLYNIPFRIDINFKCSGAVKLPITTTTTTTKANNLFASNASLANLDLNSTSKSTNQPVRASSNYLNAEFAAAAGVESKEPTGLTTRLTASGNADTDRTVMIILIVLGAIFFSIIFAIIILICIRKRNQKKMDREFVYKSDKISTNSTSSVQYGISTNGSLNEKPHLPVPFTATSSSSAIRGFETNLNELNGTYRARNNLGFENSQDKLNNQINVGGLPPKFDKKSSKKARVDFDEYWRTNI